MLLVMINKLNSGILVADLNSIVDYADSMCKDYFHTCIHISKVIF